MMGGEITIAELASAMSAAEERLQVDLLQVVFFADGSGHVMAPCHDYSDGGQRTDEFAFEEVGEFQSPAEAMTWLREGVLPEQRPAAELPNALTCEDFEGVPV